MSGAYQAECNTAPCPAWERNTGPERCRETSDRRCTELRLQTRPSPAGTASRAERSSMCRSLTTRVEKPQQHLWALQVTLRLQGGDVHQRWWPQCSSLWGAASPTHHGEPRKASPQSDKGPAQAGLPDGPAGSTVAEGQGQSGTGAGKQFKAVKWDFAWNPSKTRSEVLKSS